MLVPSRVCFKLIKIMFFSQSKINVCNFSIAGEGVGSHALERLGSSSRAVMSELRGDTWNFMDGGFFWGENKGNLT